MIDCMNQWAGSDVAIETPLYHAGLAEIAHKSAKDGAGVVVEELPLTGLLSLRADPASVNLADVLQTELQLALPERLQSTASQTHCLRWMAPDDWWLSGPIEENHALEGRLRSGVSGHIAIVDLSAGYTFLTLSGPAALDVLMKSTGYDVHPRSFGPGKTVRTVFGKTGIALRCIGELHYELIVRRSYADYLWVWLQAASEEFGLRIEA